MRDRRTGSYSRHLLTELGDIELSVPRTRRFCPSEVLRSYARRAPEIDRAILAGVVLGLSTRKVGEVLLARLGRKVSASTVSRVAKTLDEAVAACHARPLADRYKALMLDGVVLARRTGAGALKRPVLVALGIRADGKKEIIDFHLATGESAAAWERFLTDLYRRGLTGNGLEMICADGGRGLIAALPTVYPGICSAAGRTKSGTCWARSARPTTAPSRLPSTPSGTPPTGPRRSVPHAASPVPGKRPTPRPSPACATTSTTCSPASATPPLPSAAVSEPPTPSNDASARSGAGPDPWAHSRTAHQWTASSSPSSSTKTKHRE